MRNGSWPYFKVTEPKIVDLKIPLNMGQCFHRIDLGF
jgi:hypothetical protein